MDDCARCGAAARVAQALVSALPWRLRALRAARWSSQHLRRSSPSSAARCRRFWLFLWPLWSCEENATVTQLLPRREGRCWWVRPRAATWWDADAQTLDAVEFPRLRAPLPLVAAWQARSFVLIDAGASAARAGALNGLRAAAAASCAFEEGARTRPVEERAAARVRTEGLSGRPTQVNRAQVK